MDLQPSPPDLEEQLRIAIHTRDLAVAQCQTVSRVMQAYGLTGEHPADFIARIMNENLDLSAQVDWLKVRLAQAERQK